jgi:hypothetical protein
MAVIRGAATIEEAQAVALALAWFVEGHRAELERCGFAPPILRDLAQIIPAAGAELAALAASEQEKEKVTVFPRVAL